MRADANATPERLRCPQHFQRRVTQAGGLNRYRKPNFMLAWAQTATTRQGGEWEAEGDTFLGYRDVLLGDGLPHWMLLQWCDAGKCIEMPHLPPQSDASFYSENRCHKTGLQLLGEYPYQGSYKIALNLCAKIFARGQMYIEAFPLSTEIVEMMVPIIKASLAVSLEAKMRFLRESREKEDEEFAKTVDDVWHGAKRKAALASTAWLEDKQRSIERSFNAALITMMHRNRRFQGRPNA